MSKKLLNHGIYAIGFFFPVVPKGKARIRTQISAAHKEEDLDKAIELTLKNNMGGSEIVKPPFGMYL